MLLASGLGALFDATRAGATVAPPGWEVVAASQPAPGVEVVQLRRPQGPVVAHVARVARDSGMALRTVVSGDRVAGGIPAMERTSAMCRRVGCVVAVNGDFASVNSGQPIGGVVARGELLRTPVSSHHQLSLTTDGRLTSEALQWSGRLVASDLGELALDAVNRSRQADELVLYTPAWGASTGTNAFGAELVVRIVEPPPPLRLDQTALVEITALRDGEGDAAIPVDGAVVSAHGTAAAEVRALWARVEGGTTGRRLLLRLETSPRVAESIGGAPVLVRAGRRWVADDGSSFVHGTHPRTVVGWGADGTALLVAVDGRQPGYSVGLGLVETADLLLALGAVEAVNLDGGGSTTLVVSGGVVNRPSDRLVRRSGGEHIVHQPGRADAVVGAVERPVADVLAVVPQSDAPVRPANDPLARTSPQLPRELALAVPTADPASRPGDGLPALVGETGDGDVLDTRLVVVAVLLDLASVAAVAVATARRRAVG